MADPAESQKLTPKPSTSHSFEVNKQLSLSGNNDEINNDDDAPTQVVSSSTLFDDYNVGATRHNPSGAMPWSSFGNASRDGSHNQSRLADMESDIPDLKLSLSNESEEDDDEFLGSELNIATTTTEDEDFKNSRVPETIELRVLNTNGPTARRYRPESSGFRDIRHQPTHDYSLENDKGKGGIKTRTALGSDVETEGDVDDKHASRSTYHSSDQLSEQSSPAHPSGILLRYQTGTTTLETTVDTEDDRITSPHKRPVKMKRKRPRHPASASETDTVDLNRSPIAQHRAHSARRIPRRVSNARTCDRVCDAGAHIIFVPFPLAIISSDSHGRDAVSSALRRAIDINDVNADNGDEGDVDDDHGNEKEDDEDDHITDDESVASTFISVAATRQTLSRSNSTLDVPTCRICFQPEEEGSHTYRLVSPCLCEGSIKYVHQACVNRWIAESGTPSCELCGYRFHLRTLTMRNFFNWRRIELNHWDKVHLLLGFFSLVFVVLSLCYMMWATFSSHQAAVFTRSSIASEVLFPIYACLDALTMCVCSYEMSNTFRRLWRRLRATNCCLVVMDKPRLRPGTAPDTAVLRPEDIESETLHGGERHSERESYQREDAENTINRRESINNEENDMNHRDVHIDPDTSHLQDGLSPGSRSAVPRAVSPADDRSIQISLASYDPLTPCSTSILIDDESIYEKAFDEDPYGLESMV